MLFFPQCLSQCGYLLPYDAQNDLLSLTNAFVPRAISTAVQALDVTSAKVTAQRVLGPDLLSGCHHSMSAHGICRWQVRLFERCIAGLIALAQSSSLAIFVDSPWR